MIAALDAGADVAHAARAALPQRVGPLLWEALEVTGRSAGHGVAGDALEVDSLVRRTQAALLIPRAVALAVEPLSRAGLEPLIFKGPAVSSRYPSPGLRPMDDIDVLLPHRDHERAVAALEASGWKVFHSHYRHDYDTVLTHPDIPDLPLELHRGLSSWRNRSNALTVDALWSRRVPINCFGTDAFGLPPEEDLVALAAHAGKPFHTFGRLMWVVDLAMVARHAGAGFDWDQVGAFATAARCRTSLAVGLRLAGRLGLDAPEKLLALPGRRSRGEALKMILDERWPVTVVDESTRYWMRFALADSAIHHAVMVVGDVTLNGVKNAPMRAARLAYSGARRWLPPRRGGADQRDGAGNRFG